MPRSTTRHNYNSALYVYTNYDVASPDTFIAGGNPVAELVTASLSGAGHPPMEITHLDSPDGMKEKLPGWGEGGEIALKFNYTPILWALLDSLAPDLSNDSSPAYGRQRIDISDAFGSTLTARVIMSIPTKEQGEDGKDMISVTATVAESRPIYTAA